MPPRRLHKTLADYIGIAISPLLIIVLVGSFVFFLLEAGYDGQFKGRLRWTLFWFVTAGVLVARIGIEQGRARARVYGLALAAALTIVIFTLVKTFVWGVLGLLAVIWWATNKLVWDCTLIDDSVDASGQGLLQAAGMDDEEGDPSSPAPHPTTQRTTDNGQRTSPSPLDPQRSTSWWQRLSGDDSQARRRPHAPGLWVIYFSLAALPLFGLGQLLIPAEEPEQRSFAFKLLWLYVAAGLGLLLTTSFLGLRRYLRQRRLRMPAAMAASWLGIGAVLAVVVLLGCMLLPRPQGDYTLTALVEKLASKVRDASQVAFLNNDAGQGEGQRTGKPDEKQKDQQQQQQQADADQQPGENEGRPRENLDKGEGAGRNKENARGRDEGRGQGGKGQASGQGEGKKAQGDRQGKGEQSGGEQKQGKQSGQQGGNGKSKDAKGSSRKDNSGQARQGEGKRAEEQGGGKGQRPIEERPRQADDRKADERKADEQRAARKQKERRENGRAGGGRRDRAADKAQPTDRPQSSSDSSSTAAWIGNLVKWIIYAILAALLLWFVIRNWRQIAATLRQLWEELRNLFAGLFGGRTSQAAAGEGAEEGPASRPPRPFSSFQDPFLTGRADQMSPSAIVQYTFEALQAWAREQRIERGPDETPLEFARKLGEHAPRLAGDVRQTARLYSRIAYAQRRAPPEGWATREQLDAVRRLWILMQETASVGDGMGRERVTG